MSVQRPLRVCINARLFPGKMGGVEQLTSGLLSGLSQLADPHIQVFALASEQSVEWLEGLNYPGIEIVHPPKASLRSSARRLVTQILSSKWTRDIFVTGKSHLKRELSPSDGTVERLNADVVHFPFQAGFKTSLPSIYQPHDLQHLHLPQFFNAANRKIRTRAYTDLCHQARSVVVVSDWVKNDLNKHLGIPREKIWVLPYAPPLHEVRENAQIPSEIADRLPSRYLLYPAQTWPHKNHISLFRALALLRDRNGETIHLVCTGRRNEHSAVLQAEIEHLKLVDQVHFFDFVATEHLAAIFRQAKGTIIPTLFEAASFPIWEAFHAGSPVACSNVTSLPEQVGDAALLFDPLNVDEIASCIRSIWKDDQLAATLVQRGHQGVNELSWLRTARGFATLYKAVGKRDLSESELQIQEWALKEGDHFRWPSP